MIETLQKTIDDIEESLFEKLDINTLASKAGYSYYSYQHLFKSYVGMPIGTYITKRRLELAIYGISQGMSMTDGALAHGFETYAGFYKAFSRYHGCSPKRYLALNKVGPTTKLDLLRESKKMLLKKEIIKVLENWDLTKEEIDIVNAQPEDIYVHNEAYHIGEKYIFKTGKNIPWVLTHVNMTKALKEVGLESPYPIATKTGKDCIIEDDRYYILLHKIQGEVLSLEERLGQKGYDYGILYGKAIGELHLVLKSIENELEVIDASLKRTLDNWAFGDAKALIQQWSVDIDDSFFVEVKEKYSLLYDKLPKQLIHRDPNPMNIIFHEGKVAGFIDFEISELNYRIFDLCYCGTGNFVDLYDKEDGFEKWLVLFRGMVEGYNSVIELTKEEKEAIPYVVFGIQLLFIAYLGDKDAHREMAKQNREMLEILWKRREEIKF